MSQRLQGVYFCREKLLIVSLNGHPERARADYGHPKTERTPEPRTEPRARSPLAACCVHVAGGLAPPGGPEAACVSVRVCVTPRDPHLRPCLRVPSADAGSLSLQGPKGESVGSITQPLPSSYLIFRAASESDGESPAALWVSLVGPRLEWAPRGHRRPGARGPCPDPPLPPKQDAGRCHGTSLGLGRAGLPSTSYLSEPQFPQAKT